MNKTELISAVAAATELSRKDADKAVNAAEINKCAVACDALNFAYIVLAFFNCFPEFISEFLSLFVFNGTD